ncbi:MAG: molybdate ABC transporter substrate-binding protein [Solidesulfovibrio sp. DCME]|uniref:molybdate ABC transporter substrate-binding protein n=1 Tax=Solidesulfovibrio sp. DCME TaxID=3447380 RepID=UPI003D0A1886
MTRIRLPAALLLACLVVLAARPGRCEELVVSGAASLTAAMTEIKKAFESEHPDITVFTNFAASGQLLQQIQAGAPVDVFAPADQVTMDRAAQGGLIDPATRLDFTANELMLTVPADLATVTCLEDLAGPKVGRLALGEPDAVPAGSYTKQALDNVRLWERLAPKMVYGLSVKQALDYVALGEVDAAFVYATDARMAQKRVRVVAALTGHAPIVYPAAMVATCPRKDAAKAFIAFLAGDKGQAILASFGFKSPADR